MSEIKIHSPITLKDEDDFEALLHKLYAEGWSINSSEYMQADTPEEAVRIQAKTFDCLEFQPVKLPLSQRSPSYHNTGRWVAFHRTPRPAPYSYEALTERLKKEAPSQPYPIEGELWASCMGYIDRILHENNLDKHDSFERKGRYLGNLNSLRTFLKESWCNGWDIRETIKEIFVVVGQTPMMTPSPTKTEEKMKESLPPEAVPSPNVGEATYKEVDMLTGKVEKTETICKFCFHPKGTANDKCRCSCHRGIEPTQEELPCETEECEKCPDPCTNKCGMGVNLDQAGKDEICKTCTTKECKSPELEQPPTINVQFRKMFKHTDPLDIREGDKVLTENNEVATVTKIESGEAHHLDGKVYTLEGFGLYHESAISAIKQKVDEPTTDDLPCNHMGFNENDCAKCPDPCEDPYEGQEQEEEEEEEKLEEPKLEEPKDTSNIPIILDIHAKITKEDPTPQNPHTIGLSVDGKAHPYVSSGSAFGCASSHDSVEEAKTDLQRWIEQQKGWFTAGYGRRIIVKLSVENDVTSKQQALSTFFNK